MTTFHETFEWYYNESKSMGFTQPNSGKSRNNYQQKRDQNKKRWADVKRKRKAAKKARRKSK